YQTFIIQSGQACNTSELWGLTGPETNIVLEAGATLVANHAIGNASSDISLELASNATYEHNNGSGYIWQASVVADPTSTIRYGYAGDQSIAAVDYGNLRASGGGDKTLLGDVSVRGDFELSGARVV